MHLNKILNKIKYSQKVILFLFFLLFPIVYPNILIAFSFVNTDISLPGNFDINSSAPNLQVNFSGGNIDQNNSLNADFFVDGNYNNSFSLSSVNCLSSSCYFDMQTIFGSGLFPSTGLNSLLIPSGAFCDSNASECNDSFNLDFQVYQPQVLMNIIPSSGTLGVGDNFGIEFYFESDNFSSNGPGYLDVYNTDLGASQISLSASDFTCSSNFCYSNTSYSLNLPGNYIIKINSDFVQGSNYGANVYTEGSAFQVVNYLGVSGLLPDGSGPMLGVNDNILLSYYFNANDVYQNNTTLNMDIDNNFDYVIDSTQSINTSNFSCISSNCQHFLGNLSVGRYTINLPSDAFHSGSLNAGNNSNQHTFEVVNNLSITSISPSNSVNYNSNVDIILIFNFNQNDVVTNTGNIVVYNQNTSTQVGSYDTSYVNCNMNTCSLSIGSAGSVGSGNISVTIDNGFFNSPSSSNSSYYQYSFGLSVTPVLSINSIDLSQSLLVGSPFPDFSINFNTNANYNSGSINISGPSGNININNNNINCSGSVCTVSNMASYISNAQQGVYQISIANSVFCPNVGLCNTSYFQNYTPSLPNSILNFNYSSTSILTINNNLDFIFNFQNDASASGGNIELHQNNSPYSTIDVNNFSCTSNTCSFNIGTLSAGQYSLSVPANVFTNLINGYSSEIFTIRDYLNIINTYPVSSSYLNASSTPYNLRLYFDIMPDSIGSGFIYIYKNSILVESVLANDVVCYSTYCSLSSSTSYYNFNDIGNYNINIDAGVFNNNTYGLSNGSYNLTFDIVQNPSIISATTTFNATRFDLEFNNLLILNNYSNILIQSLSTTTLMDINIASTSYSISTTSPSSLTLYLNTGLPKGQNYLISIATSTVYAGLLLNDLATTSLFVLPRSQDIDNDGLLNNFDNDIDGDSLLNALDTDIDNDGILNNIDIDDDDDGLDDMNDGEPNGRGSSTDYDGDGVLNSQEAPYPNFDGNGDGIADEMQTNVSNITNTLLGTTTTLAVSGGCNIVDGLTFKTENNFTNDDNYNYPYGFMDFRLNCNGSTTSYADIQLFYPAGLSTSTWEFRKYNGNMTSYRTLNPGQVTVNSLATSTVITYRIYDGGIDDEDGLQNGYIEDPFGIGMIQNTQSLVTNNSNIGSYHGGGGYSFSTNNILNNNVLLGSTSNNICVNIINGDIGFSNKKSNKNDIINLKKFLNENYNYKFKLNNVIDKKLKKAITIYQEKHKDKILTPYGFKKGTGIVAKGTRIQINKEYCNK